MARIIVFNNDTDRMENYYRGESEPMPYNVNNTLKVREFRGSSRSNILWTTKRTMQSWNRQRSLYGGPIPVGYAFKRPYEGGHSNMSQHYAGVAFDVGQRLTQSQRTRIWQVANNSGVWSYIEPISLTPTWVHFDKRYGRSACASGGYPLISLNSVGVYVLVAQDCLNTLGHNTGGLDGIFGSRTLNSVKNYQQGRGLQVDGIIGCNTWRALLEDVVAKGRTSTTVD